MLQMLRSSLRPGLLLLGLAVTGCTSLSGPERLARVDKMVAQQEYAKAAALLSDIDARDAEFEALVVRRRALRPLIVQFEEGTLRKVEALKKSDDWPEAEALIKEARGKLPRSAMLQMVEEQFYADRNARLEQLSREMSLLLGEHLNAKSRLVEQAANVHPDGVKNRWRSFRHSREREQVARALVKCSHQALDEARHELAESCLKMADQLSEDEVVKAQLLALKERHHDKERQARAQGEAQRAAEADARQARTVEQLGELKLRYQYLMDTGWLAAAREVLDELQNRAPDDPEILLWGSKLQALIKQRVADQTAEGQALYSAGRLREALAVWREAQKLAPEDAVLQAHITRVERFIAKLERLDNDDV